MVFGAICGYHFNTALIKRSIFLFLKLRITESLTFPIKGLIFPQSILIALQPLSALSAKV
jgi:hypothetical protein